MGNYLDIPLHQVNKEILKKELEKEGFKHIYEWTDEPGIEYPPHKHKDKVSFYIVDGSINLIIDDKNIELKKGDRFDVPPNTKHTAKVGPEGCTYLVGEMIEGDS